jgi:presqualene diphosphate synthase
VIVVVATDTRSSNAQTRASGSSFYTAMRFLPAPQREALFEIYGLCRALDDVADARGARDRRLRELDRWRAAVQALYAGSPPAGLQGLAVAVERYDLQQRDMLALIEGMEMDVVADIRAPDHPTLDLYCDRVASAVGRLCVRVFGLTRDDGVTLAHHLGRALQLTNILRDVDEDAQMGRLYIPREALDAAGISTSDPIVALLNPALDRACRRVAENAEEHFRTADEVMRRCPRQTVRAPRIMAAAYKQLLARLLGRGWSPPRSPVHLSRPQLLWFVLRYAFI